MTCISCFKHEQEILLYSQILPIKSTKTFETNDKRLVDHFLFSLKATKKRITDKDEFFKQIGVSFKKEWISLLSIPPMLFDLTAFGPKNRKWNLHERMVQEFKLTRLCPSEELEMIHDLRKYIIYNDDAFRITDQVHCIPGWVISFIIRHEFTVAVDGVSTNLHYRFTNIMNFYIPIVNMYTSGTTISLSVGNGAYVPVPVCSGSYEMQQSKQRNGKFLEIPLSVHSHERHVDVHHPRNLLQKGVSSEYQGGSWVMFKVESAANLIPKVVIIRNNDIWSTYGGIPRCAGLRSIQLSASINGYSSEPLAEINYIHSDNRQEQYFNLTGAAVRDNYQFIGLEMQNWGGSENIFHYFSIFGVLR